MNRLPTALDALDDAELFRWYAHDAEIVRVGMACDLTGSVVDENGVSTGLGGDADLRVFRIVRANADVVVVGAGTVRDEQYDSVKFSDQHAALRADHGRRAELPFAVVTSSGDLGDAPILTDDGPPPIFVTSESNLARVRDKADAVGAGVVAAGSDDVDLAEAIRILQNRWDLQRVLIEGGPGLNTAAVRADVVDQWCLTLVSQLGRIDGPKLVSETVPTSLTISAALHSADGLHVIAETSPRADAS